jgi:rod shape-determining protein MreD
VRLPLYALAVSGGTLVQGTLVPMVGLQGVVPDLPVILVLLLALRRGPEVGCLLGAALGLAQDVLAGGPLGLHALSKAVVGFLAGDLPRWLLVQRGPVTVAVAVVATVGDGLLRFGLLQLFRYPAPLGEILVGVILPQAAYNGLLAALVVGLPVLWPVPRLAARRR